MFDKIFNIFPMVYGQKTWEYSKTVFKWEEIRMFSGDRNHLNIFYSPDP